MPELKRYLLEHRELFIRALAGKLLSYATGRKLQESDRPALDRIAAQALPDPQFGNVVLEVLRSTPLQLRGLEP